METSWTLDPQGRAVVDRPDRLGRVPIQMLACGSSYFGIVDALLRGFSGHDYARMLGEFDGPTFPKGQFRGVWVREGGRARCVSFPADPAAPPDRLESVLDLGEVTLRASTDGLEAETSVFLPVEGKAECWEVRLRNASGRDRVVDVALVLPLFAGSRAYVEYHRDVVRLYNKPLVRGGRVEIANGLEWIEGRSGPSALRYVAAAALDGAAAPDRVWTDREDLLGGRGEWTRPEAILADRAPRLSGLGRELVAAFEWRGVRLPAGGARTLALSAGVADDGAEADRIAALASPAAVAEARRAVAAFWAERTGAVRIRTADPDLDSSWNRWWLHQALVRHWFGNTGHPQFDYGSDFSGWREIWQDLMATTPLDPEAAREASLYVLTGVRPDGTNATRFFTRTGRFGSDEVNGLWCDHPYWTLQAVRQIVDETGDLQYLVDREVGWFRDAFRARGDRKDAAWPAGTIGEAPAADGRPLRGTVLEHLLVQSLGMYHDCGDRGLLKLRRADWNDAVDQVHGGENVVFSCGLVRNLRLLAETVDEIAARLGLPEITLFEAAARLVSPGANDGAARGRRERMREFLAEADAAPSARRVAVPAADLARDLREKADALTRVVREVAYNGEYFFGYIQADGRPIEETGESKIHLMAQTYALYTDAVRGAEVDRLVEAVFRLLGDPKGGLRLNAPAYTRFDPAIGRITGFAPGTKENAAVFNHANLYFMHAMLLRRRAAEAWRVFRGIATCWRPRGATAGPHLPEYWISSDHPHLAGRAEYPLLTGTGPWTRLVVPRHLFGVRGDLDGLRIDPCLPDDDVVRDSTIELPFRGGRYRIRFRVPKGVSGGRVVEARLDGKAVAPRDGALLLPPPHAGTHEVEVTVG